MIDVYNSNLEDIEDYILKLENKIDDLENQIEIKDEVIEDLKSRRW